MRCHATLLKTGLAAALIALLAIGTPLPADATGTSWIREAQRDLNALHCDAGPVDGQIDRTELASELELWIFRIRQRLLDRLRPENVHGPSVSH